MRKRSAAVEGQSPTPVQASPPTPAPPPSGPREASLDSLPEHVTVDNGIVFIKCPDCGLNQSSDTAVRKKMPNGHDLLHCKRCNGLVDPDEELSPEFIMRLKAIRGTSKPAQEAPAPSKAPQERPAPENAPAPVQGAAKAYPEPIPAPKCIVCGKPLTQTALGNMPSCGHPQTGAPSTTPARAIESIEGETVTVCYGEEKFSPAQYQSFSNGPFFATTRVRQGETQSQAAARIYSELRVFADIEFKRKAKEFLERIKDLTAQMGDRR
jgi:hypothetical protein